MGFLDRLFGRKQESEPVTRLKVDVDYQPEGIMFGVYIDHEGLAQARGVDLPIDLAEPPASMSPQVRAQLLTLQDLLSQELALQIQPGVLLLDATDVHQLAEVDRGILGLVYERGWKASLKMKVPPGHGKARAELRWTHPKEGYLGALNNRKGERFEAIPCGFYDHRENRIALLPPELISLRDKTQENYRSGSLGETLYLARIKKATEALKIQQEDGVIQHFELEVGTQLEKEDYRAPEKVKVKVKPGEDGSLELQPELEGIESQEVSEQLLNQPMGSDLLRRPGPEGQRIHVALRPEVSKAVDSVRKHRHISPDKVADFLRSPREFLEPATQQAEIPEEEWEESTEEEPSILDLTDVDEVAARFNLGEYGDRVTGLAPLTPGGPEPSVSDNGRSWFSNDNEDEEELDLEALELAQKEEPIVVTEEEPTTQRLGLTTADNDDELQYERRQWEGLAKATKDYDMPVGFAGKLYAYQREGYVWFRQLWDQCHVDSSSHGRGGLLADDMGLGKTVQAAAFLCWLHEQDPSLTTLIVGPKSLLENWKRELRRFCPDITRVYLHAGPQRCKDKRFLSGQEIILTTYDTLGRDQLLLGQLEFAVMVCDEAQSIKNYTTRRAVACRAMNAKLPLALTATPVENRLMELWAIYDFVCPGLLGTRRDFEAQWVEPLTCGEDVRVKEASHALQKHLGKTYLRRTKQTHLAGQLPGKTVHRYQVGLSDAQRKLYKTIQHHARQKEGRGHAMAALRELRDVCVHEAAWTRYAGQSLDPLPQCMKQPDSMLSSPKLASLIEKLEEVKRLEDKAIIFVESRRVQLMVKALLLHYFMLDVPVINGDVHRRVDLIESFGRRTGFGILLLSPLAAGVGLNITMANHVFHLMRLWNPARESQATDRVYRIGQEKPVHVYIPIASEEGFRTMEMGLDELLSSKRDVAERAIRANSLELGQQEIQCLLDSR